MRKHAITVASVVLLASLALVCARLTDADDMRDETLGARTANPHTASEQALGGIDWDYWLGVNPSIVGWIAIPGTSIDGPVAQAPQDDPTYYLDHDARLDPAIGGCPYVDAECAGFDGLAAVVSGHHVSDGSVLSDLALFLDPGFAQEHRAIEVATPGGSFTAFVDGVELMPGFQKAKRTEFATRGMLKSWYADKLEGCDVLLNAEGADALDRAMVLVTCASADPSDDRRVVVYASIP